MKYRTKEEQNAFSLGRFVTICPKLTQRIEGMGLVMVQIGGQEFARQRARAGYSIDDTARVLGVSTRQVRRYETGECAIPPLYLTFIRAHADNCIASQQKPHTWFRFIDLFAGIGGMRLGFEAIGGKCVFTSEWDKYCQQTYLANFPNDDHDIAGDIREITNGNLDRIPAHDVLLAGFPCQPFSIAGVSKKNALNRPHGFACEAQGTLFFEVAKIIQHHRPKAFLLENVKNLVNHDRGRTFQVIHNVLTKELRYTIDWKIIDAKAWLPQHRERIFIAGFADDEEFNFGQLRLPDPLSGPRLNTILHPEDSSEAPEKPYTDGNIGSVSKKYTLSDHLWNYLKDYAEKHRERGNGFGFGLFGPDGVARTLSARYYKDGSEILIRQDGRAPRRLTPRECARIMGFDTARACEFKIPVSDTQAYRQFGNSVAVPAVKAVAQYMEDYLRKSISCDLENSAVA